MSIYERSLINQLSAAAADGEPGGRQDLLRAAATRIETYMDAEHTRDKRDAERLRSDLETANESNRALAKALLCLLPMIDHR